MEEDIKLNILGNNDELINIVVIDKFTKNNKNYLIYNEENNEEEIYAALFEINEKNLKIIPITETNDYDVVDEYLSGL